MGDRPTLPDVSPAQGGSVAIGQFSTEDAYSRPSGGTYAYYIHYIDYPAIGSVFSGPWVCEARRFYDGRYLQVEYDADGVSDRVWEPLRPELPQPWHDPPKYHLVPLVALWAKAAPEGPPVERTKMSRDDGGGTVASAPTVRCYVCSASADGRELTVTRTYGESHNGHYGDGTWKLHRADGAPPHEQRHTLQPSIFAGKWRCAKGEFFSGDIIHIEIGGARALSPHRLSAAQPSPPLSHHRPHTACA